MGSGETKHPDEYYLGDPVKGLRGDCHCGVNRNHSCMRADQCDIQFHGTVRTPLVREKSLVRGRVYPPPPIHPFPFLLLHT